MCSVDTSGGARHPVTPRATGVLCREDRASGWMRERRLLSAAASLRRFPSHEIKELSDSTESLPKEIEWFQSQRHANLVVMVIT